MPYPPLPTYPSGVWPSPQIDYEAVRRIVREEIEAALTKALAAPTAISPDPTRGDHG
jgi:(2Fe-2S) ferredoxin